MSKTLSEVLEANSQYSANFNEKGKLALPPAKLRDSHLYGCPP